MSPALVGWRHMPRGQIQSLVTAKTTWPSSLGQCLRSKQNSELIKERRSVANYSSAFFQKIMNQASTFTVSPFIPPQRTNAPMQIRISLSFLTSEVDSGPGLPLLQIYPKPLFIQAAAGTLGWEIRQGLLQFTQNTEKAVGKILPSYTAQQPRRQLSTYSQLQEPKISYRKPRRVHDHK